MKLMVSLNKKHFIEKQAISDSTATPFLSA